MEKKADFLFEVSWEVCNKVGGIYTVVKSKVGPALDRYGENYFLVGPYFQKKVFGSFEELPPPDNLKQVIEQLHKEGLDIHYGTWVVKGSPKVFLIDFSNYTQNKDVIKKNMWDWYGIDSLNTDWFDFDEPLVWSCAVGRLLEAFAPVLGGKIVAQFHEWLAGGALLYARKKGVNIGTVFTTHATTLGRSLAIHGRSLYLELDELHPEEEAQKLGPAIKAKHLLEKAAAQNAHVFTTVSEITGIEAEKILGRKPDVLLYNGLDMSKFPVFEDASIKHRFFKQRIKQFLMYYFFPYYTFDLDNTLIYFLAGRYEYRDKGIDVFIKSLARLNEQLKEEKDGKTVVAFFWVPGNVKGIRPEVLRNRTLYFDVKDSVDDNSDVIKNRLLNILITKQEIAEKSLLGEDLLDELKPKTLRLKAQGLPPLSTHELFNEHDDPIMNELRKVGLQNREEDRVKIVFYPIYLTGADNLLDTSYYESMIGSDLGVFPSYYEPWGYTPLEAAALGISSLTTDLSGFGRYLCVDCSARPKKPGIFVLSRFKKAEDEIISELTEMMNRFAHFSKKERVENKIAAQQLARTADWNTFFDRYVEAHNLAVEKS